MSDRTIKYVKRATRDMIQKFERGDSCTDDELLSLVTLFGTIADIAIVVPAYALMVTDAYNAQRAIRDMLGWRHIDISQFELKFEV